MAGYVKGNTIVLPRGDSFKTFINIQNSSGEPYHLEESDIVMFAIKKNFTDEKEIYVQKLEKINGKLELYIKPSVTSALEVAKYKYDVSLMQRRNTTASDPDQYDVHTVIVDTIILKEEVLNNSKLR